MQQCQLAVAPTKCLPKVQGPYTGCQRQLFGLTSTSAHQQIMIRQRHTISFCKSLESLLLDWPTVQAPFPNDMI